MPASADRSALGRSSDSTSHCCTLTSAWDFRDEVILLGPLADVIPSTTEFEMYPVGITSIAAYLEASGDRL
jgi:hypothetical protein